MILSTERLLLREFEERDWRPMLDYQSRPEYLFYNPWVYRTEMDVRSYLHMFMGWSSELPRRKFQLAIVLKDENRLIGNCGIRMAQAHARTADLGYEIDHRYWRRGYATEAAHALLAFGFEQLYLHRIWAQCVLENSSSAAVLEKIGMTYEGCQRESEWMKGRWWSTKLYSILDHEWPITRRF